MQNLLARPQLLGQSRIRALRGTAAGGGPCEPPPQELRHRPRAEDGGRGPGGPACKGRLVVVGAEPVLVVGGQ